MIIYRPGGTALTSIEVDDESYHFAEIMGRDDVTLYFSLPHYMEFPVGCYITYMQQPYTLYSVDKMRMEHRRDYEYTITFQSQAALLENYIFTNPNDGRFKFPLTARPEEHLSLLCLCLTRKTGLEWTAANHIDSTDKLISYDSMTCTDALKQMADTFETEFRIDGRTIHLGKVEFYTNIDQQVPISYGKGNGLRPGVEKIHDDGEKVIGRVYIQGGERNIDLSQYGSATLLLPKNTHIWYDGENFYDSSHTGATEFASSSDGRYVALVSNDAPAAEGALDLTDVYPCYDHEVSAVQEVDAENHFWDIYSDTFTAGTSTITKINYEDSLIANGGDMTVIFQSGALSGREFGVKWKTKEVTEDNETTTIAYMEIVPSEQDGYTMPDGPSGFHPSVDDVFRVFNVYLPNSYILSAEMEMLHQAVSYLYEHCREKFSIKGEVDPIWSASRWDTIGLKFKPGAYFRFTDPTWESDGVSIRVINIKTFINKPHRPIVELSNSIGRQGVSTALKKVEAEAKTLPYSVRDESIAFTKRSYKDAEETMEALAQAMLEGFSESVSPITVKTMQMIAGSEQLQITFWTDRTCTTQVSSSQLLTYNSTTKKLSWISCALQHMTLGITDIKPESARTLSEYKIWSIYSDEYTPEDPTKLYYVYARCSKNYPTVTTGEFIVRDTAIEMEGEAGYYHFLVAILNSERDGNRSIAPVYGFTEVLPGQITTDVIRSSSGNSYFDLVAEAFKLGNRLTYSPSGGLVLNGAFVQTGQSDELAAIGAWCGEYDEDRIYKRGDEVSYTVGTAISTYRYINEYADNGHDPTDTDYWEVTAQGTEGGSGQGVFKSIVFKRSDSTPSTPSGGSYLSPVPSGWSDGVPSGSEILWMSTRVFTSDGESPQENTWTTPQKATSGDAMDYRWSASSSQPSPPGQESGSNLPWTATRDVSWITLGSSSGTGAGTLSYSVSSNSSSSSRTGHIIISYSGGSKTFTITQSGTSSYTGTISPVSVSNVSYSGTTQTFTIQTTGAWTLTSNNSWITLSSSSGTGNASVTATISANTGSSGRTGSISFVCGSTSTSIPVSQSANSSSNATIYNPSPISSSAVEIQFVISDPNNHGWTFGNSTYMEWGNYIDTPYYVPDYIYSGTGNSTLAIGFLASDSPLTAYFTDLRTNEVSTIIIRRS